jgi:hypothetical protein
MALPFTAEQFFGVFRAYNEALWPAQVFLLAVALVAVALIGSRQRWSGIGVSAILAFLWAWLGVVYHWAFFAAINPLAGVFSAVSIAGAMVFLWEGVIRHRLEFRFARSARTFAGVLLVLFALVVYPAWSVWAGHRYPAMPTFGLPCPTTLFTIGVLAFLVVPHPRSPLAVPVLWCLIGFQAAFFLDVPQDLALLVAAALGMLLMAGHATEPRASLR